MTYSPDEFFQHVVLDLQAEALAMNVELQGWEASLYQEHLSERVAIEMIRLIAEHEQVPEEEVFEYRKEWRTFKHNEIDTVWDMVKYKWLRFARLHLGLTAPFFRPKFTPKVGTYEFRYPSRIKRTEVIRVIAAPGTRHYTIAQGRPFYAF